MYYFSRFSATEGGGLKFCLRFVFIYLYLFIIIIICYYLFII